ncbi:MAG: AMP-binding protein [Thermoprotei archaeon]
MIVLQSYGLSIVYKEFIDLIKIPNNQEKEAKMRAFFTKLNDMKLPDYFNWEWEIFEGIHVREYGQRVGLHWVNLDTQEERKYSYSDLSNETNKLINYLRGNGLSKGDSLYMMMPLIPELWVTFLAVIKAGFVGVPIATTLTLADLIYRFNAYPPKAIIADEQSVKLIDESIEKTGIKPVVKLVIGEKSGWESYESIKSESTRAEPAMTRNDDPIFLYFTSGTTGMPKRVIHTATSYPVGHLSTAMIINVQPGGVHNNLSAPGWAKYAWSSFFAPFNVGATVTGFYYSGRLEPDKYLHAIEELKVSTFCAPPTAWRAFLKSGMKKFNFDYLYDAVSAGEPLGIGVYKKVLEEAKLEVRDFYGQTETTAMIGNPPWFRGNKIKPGSIGIPTFMYNMILLDDNGNEITKPGEIGHIAVKLTPWRPLGLLKSYMEKEKNEEVFRNEYYLTGDKAFFDEDGYWWFVGRSDDVIKTSDYRVGPTEIESVLIQHPAIAEIAVVASPHPERYQIVKAFVVLKPGYEPSKELALNIFMYAKKTLPYYKVPRIIEFVNDLPKTISGKILRRELRKMEEEKKSKGIKEIYEYFYDEFPELKKT